MTFLEKHALVADYATLHITDSAQMPLISGGIVLNLLPVVNWMANDTEMIREIRTQEQIPMIAISISGKKHKVEYRSQDATYSVKMETGINSAMLEFCVMFIQKKKEWLAAKQAEINN